MGKIRIIGGVHRSRQLPVIDALDLRPTLDRVKETLFNWLGQDLTSKNCLDLFAGSGSLGFEALRYNPVPALGAFEGRFPPERRPPAPCG